MEPELYQSDPGVPQTNRPRRHVVCPDVWEIIFDILNDATDANIPPIFAACARVCQDLRPIAEGRLYKSLVLGDKPSINSYLFWQVRPICTRGVSHLLRRHYIETTDRGCPWYHGSLLHGNYPIQRQSVALPLASLNDEARVQPWYSLHPTTLYRILKRSPHLSRYIRTVKVWPSRHDNGYNEDPSTVFWYLLSQPTGTWSFHEFASGLPHYIMDHLSHIVATNLDFSGVEKFQVNSLFRTAPLGCLALGTIRTEIIYPICDLESQLKFDLEILAIDFAASQSPEIFYHWFSSPACPIYASSVVSLELTWVRLRSILMDTQLRGPFKPIYWLFMVLPNIKDLSIHVSDTICIDYGQRLIPYPQPFKCITQEGQPSFRLGGRDSDDDEDVFEHEPLMTTSGLASLNNLQMLTFSGTFYDLSSMNLGGLPYRVPTCLIAFCHLLQSLKHRGSPSAITTVTFIMDFEYPRLLFCLPGPLRLPVLYEWQGVVDMLLSKTYMPNLEKVVFMIRQLPKHAKEGEKTRIKEAFSALTDIRGLIEKNLVVWKD